MNENPYQASQLPMNDAASTAATADDITKVASGQKLIIYGILIYLLAIGLQFAVGPAAALLIFATMFLGIFGIIRLAVGFGYSVISIILLIIGSFIPLVGLIILLVLNAKATKALRANGYTVGLLGASKA